MLNNPIPHMKTSLLFFIGGMVAATVARLASACPCARTMAVKGLARGMNVTEKAKEKLNKLKEEAEGMCREAKACAEAEKQNKPCCHQDSCEVPQDKN